MFNVYSPLKYLFSVINNKSNNVTQFGVKMNTAIINIAYTYSPHGEGWGSTGPRSPAKQTCSTISVGECSATVCVEEARTRADGICNYATYTRFAKFPSDSSISDCM